MIQRSSGYLHVVIELLVNVTCRIRLLILFTNWWENLGDFRGPVERRNFRRIISSVRILVITELIFEVVTWRIRKRI
jgi:hypothetical protein